MLPVIASLVAPTSYTLCWEHRAQWQQARGRNENPRGTHKPLNCWSEAGACHACIRAQEIRACMWMTGAYSKANTLSGGARISNMGQCGPHTCASGESALAPNMYIAYLHRTMSHLGIPYGAPVKAKHKCMPKYTTCRTGGACMCIISGRAHAAKHNCSDTEPLKGKLTSLGQEAVSAFA